MVIIQVDLCLMAMLLNGETSIVTLVLVKSSDFSMCRLPSRFVLLFVHRKSTACLIFTNHQFSIDPGE